MEPMKCYLAGPMRSKPDYNYPAFNEAAEWLRAKGWTVFNPAAMDKKANDAPNHPTVEEQKVYASKPANARRYARRDLRVLIDILRAENGDAIVLLPDWQESIGATAELAVARWVGLRTLELALEGDDRHLHSVP